MDLARYVAMIALVLVGHSDWATEKEAAFLYVFALGIYVAYRLQDLDERVSSIELKE